MRPCCDRNAVLLVYYLFLGGTLTSAWVTPVPSTVRRIPVTLRYVEPTARIEIPEERVLQRNNVDASKTAASVALCSLLLTANFVGTTTTANAYEASDYASETVRAAVQSVQSSVGDTTAMVKAYENIAEIITEGKGVGGEINFKGVQLDRGFVSDEDTTIYNPGLTLLTESEKERLVDAIVQSKKQSTADTWNQDTEDGYVFLREKLDPLHIYELRGYLQILPFYGAAMYLVALAAQQLARGIFPAVYIACALAVFAPVIALVAIGP